MANYIEKEEYHNLMIDAKRHGKFTQRLIDLIYLHCNEVSKLYRFNYTQDKEDAIGLAVADILQYGIKNFKDCPLIQLKFARNFMPGDTIILQVDDKIFEYTAVEKVQKDREFEIGDTINKSLDFLLEVMREGHESYLELSLHKVTMKMNIMNISHRTESPILMRMKVLGIDENLLKTHLGLQEVDLEFEPSPPSFNMVTSIIRNAYAKYFNTCHPVPTRNGNKINFSDINSKDGGIFNI